MFPYLLGGNVSFASRRCEFIVYTRHMKMSIYPLKINKKNSLKNSNYKSTTWNQNSDPPTGLWPFMEWNKLTSSSGVQTKTSSVDAILICCANTHDHFVHLLENMQSIAGPIRTSARLWENDRENYQVHPRTGRILQIRKCRVKQRIMGPI